LLFHRGIAYIPQGDIQNLNIPIEEKLMLHEQSELLVLNTPALPGFSERAKPLKTQLLKWVGNKQKQAPEIIKFFPTDYDTYIEPSLGSGGVLGVLSPRRTIASDTFKPLMEIWQALRDDKDRLKSWYSERHMLIAEMGKVAAYNQVLASYNSRPNGADFVFLCRVCYGGVVSFRKTDGYMSTPCGAHTPIDPVNFGKRVDIWHERTLGAKFEHADFSVSMHKATAGDLSMSS